MVARNKKITSYCSTGLFADLMKINFNDLASFVYTVIRPGGTLKTGNMPYSYLNTGILTKQTETCANTHNNRH